MMMFLPTPADAARWCDTQRSLGYTIGYVPTMGALHEGHISLINQAVAENHRVCASIFVNPLQFNSTADLEQYPRNLEQDLTLFETAGCAMAYTGELMDFFPQIATPEDIKPGDIKPEDIKMRHAGLHANGLEGDFRPGHLDGVATIVERLFATIGSCTVYLGEKDFQQTLVIKDIATALQKQRLRIKIRVCPTVRNANGLALSSRNQRLNPEQLELASVIYRCLQQAKSSWDDGVRDKKELQSVMHDILESYPLDIIYAVVKDELNWHCDTQPPPKTIPKPMLKPRAFVAVNIAGVRLIDNLSLLD